MSNQPDLRLANFFSGLVSGMAAITLSSPIDLARARFQLQNQIKNSKAKYNSVLHSMRRIFREEGFKGFFKGYSVAIVAMPMYYSLYFSTYGRLCDMFERKVPSWGSKVRSAFSAAVTSLLCDLVTSPLWVVRLRLQTQYLHEGNVLKYKGFFNTCDVIIKEEGYRAFSRGVVTSAFVMAHAMIFFPMYEFLKNDVFKSGRTSINVLAASLISKSIACSITYPANVIRTALIENPALIDGFDKNSKYTMRSVIKQVWKNQGFRGLYAGFTLDLIRTLPSNAVVFLTFEKTREYFQSLKNSRHHDNAHEA